MKSKIQYPTGAYESLYDIRTLSYKPTRANVKGGTRYDSKDIEDQHKVGICTSISLTQMARKALGTKFSADFQYYLQKRFYDNVVFPQWAWGEGSSPLHALKAAHNFGLLPEKDFKDLNGKPYVTEEDRKLPYHKYIDKLKAIPEDEIQRLIKLAGKHKEIKAYVSVPVTRDTLATAIDESQAGLIVRYDLGSEWWTVPIEPLRPPKQFISGHQVIETNYNGDSFRIANTWGKDWADKGTAYRIQSQYRPTEAWLVYFNELPKHVEEQLESRDSIIGKILDYLQEIIKLVYKLK